MDIVKDTLSPLSIPRARSVKDFIRGRFSRKFSSGSDSTAEGERGSSGVASDDGAGFTLQRSRAMSEESALAAMKSVPSLRKHAAATGQARGDDEGEAIFVVRKRHLLAVSLVPFLFGLAAWLIANSSSPWHAVTTWFNNYRES